MSRPGFLALLVLGLAAPVMPQQLAYLITTIAGGTLPATTAPGTSAAISSPYGVATDPAGNLYFCSVYQSTVFRLDVSGVLTRVAGNGSSGFSGDGGLAVSAQFNGPRGVALDASGSLYVADSNNNRIRNVAPNGIITTVAGTGARGSSGDGGLAVNAQLNSPYGVVADASGNVYIADSGNNRVRKISPNGVISTVAGTGTSGYSGDGGSASSAQLSGSRGVALDASGNLYVADYSNQRIRMVAPNGTITTLAGTGAQGSSGDGGPAVNAQLNNPSGVAVDASGNVYIADSGSNRVRKVSPSGAISTVAGTNAAGDYSGDGGPATSARLGNPTGVAVDTFGNLYIGSQNSGRIRKVSSGGTIVTVAGGGAGDGGLGSFAGFVLPVAVTQDSDGNTYIGDYSDNRIRKIARDGRVSTVAGTGAAGFSGDGGPATAAQINAPGQITVDASGNLYFVDYRNNRVRKVAPNGIITTVAGNGVSGHTGDGGTATNASLSLPAGVVVGLSGNLYIADSTYGLIRQVSPSGTITTVVGTGSPGFSGDGGPATGAQLNNPQGLALDASGNLYIADYGNNRVRKLAPNGIITTVAGTGPAGFSGDGGPATSAQLNGPSDVRMDSLGNLFIVDTNNNRVRRVSASGSISTVTGTGTAGYSGDGGPADRGQIWQPDGVAVDSAGNIYVADGINGAIRLLTPAGTQAVLTISSRHIGNFVSGQTGTYTLTVTNTAGAGATGGTVTVTEILPPGLALSSISGSGWNCGANTCTRSDTLAAGSSYPPITATVSVDPTAFPQLTNQVSVSGGGAAMAGGEDLTFVPGQITSVVNGASYVAGPAPGSVATIFGSGLAGVIGSATTVPLPLSLSGLAVIINGTATPLWYASPTQINFEMPADAPPGSATAILTSGGASSAPLSFTIAQVAPGIFAYGNNRAVAVNPDGSLTDADHPAAVGSMITVYLTGIGPLDNPVATNTPAPSEPLSRPSLPARATIGGQAAQIQFLGLTPGAIALAQANISVPSLAPGDYPVVITIAGTASNAPLITVGDR